MRIHLILSSSLSSDMTFPLGEALIAGYHRMGLFNHCQPNLRCRTPWMLSTFPTSALAQRLLLASDSLALWAALRTSSCC